MKSLPLASSLALFSSIMLMGAGCDTPSTMTPPSPMVTSTTHNAELPGPTIVELPIQPAVSFAVSLQGVIPELGKTTLLFTLGKERIFGRFETPTQQGSIYGSVSSTRTEAPIELSLVVGDEDVALLSGAYNLATGLFTGVTQRSANAPRTPVTLTPYIPVESATVHLETIERKKDLARGTSCHTSLEYPVLVPNAFVTEAVAKKINLQIRSFLGETSTSTLESMVNATQTDCVETLKEEATNSSAQDEEPSGINQYEYQTEVMVTRNTRGVLSLLYPSYTYTGGAHPNTLMYAQTFDLQTGKQLTLSDLVRDDVRATWIQREQRALLLSEYGDALFDREEAEKLAGGSLKGEAASSTSAYQTANAWYLVGNTLVRYYQSYEIAPYSAGVPTVELPFSTWRDLAVPAVERWFR